MQKILLLEDDLNLNRGIALLLSREGYEVRQVYTIKEAKEAFQKGDQCRSSIRTTLRYASVIHTLNLKAFLPAGKQINKK